MYDLHLKQFTKQYLELSITRNEKDIYTLIAFSSWNNDHEYQFLMTYDKYSDHSNAIINFLVENKFAILIDSSELYVKNSHTITQSRFKLTWELLLRLV